MIQALLSAGGGVGHPGPASGRGAQEAGGTGWAGAPASDSPGGSRDSSHGDVTCSLIARLLVPMMADALGMVRVGSDYHYPLSTQRWESTQESGSPPAPAPTAVLTAPPRSCPGGPSPAPSSYPHSLSACQQHTLGQAPCVVGWLRAGPGGTDAPRPLCSHPRPSSRSLRPSSRTSTASASWWPSSCSPGSCGRP